MTVQESKRIQRAYDDKAAFLVELNLKHGLDVYLITRALRNTLADALMIECLASELSDGTDARANATSYSS